MGGSVGARRSVAVPARVAAMVSMGVGCGGISTRQTGPGCSRHAPGRRHVVAGRYPPPVARAASCVRVSGRERGQRLFPSALAWTMNAARRQPVVSAALSSPGADGPRNGLSGHWLLHVSFAGAGSLPTCRFPSQLVDELLEFGARTDLTGCRSWAARRRRWWHGGYFHGVSSRCRCNSPRNAQRSSSSRWR